MRNCWPVGLLALGLAALLVTGCLSSVSMSTISTGSDGLRTFTWSHSILCTPSKAASPVSGVLRGQQGAKEPVWIESPGGQHLSVVWPAGFTVVFSPAVELRDENAKLIARDGDAVTLDQRTSTRRPARRRPVRGPRVVRRGRLLPVREGVTRGSMETRVPISTGDIGARRASTATSP